MTPLIDTHVWIWWNAAPERLSSRARTWISEAPKVLLSAISVWEFAKLAEKGRLKLAIAGESWMRTALAMPTLRVVPLTPEISWHSTQLPRPFHDDPADQIIVATARLTGATIITKDRLVRDYEHVPSAW